MQATIHGETFTVTVSRMDHKLIKRKYTAHSLDYKGTTYSMNAYDDGKQSFLRSDGLGAVHADHKNDSVQIAALKACLL